VTESRCTVLADEAIPVGEINAAEAQAEYERMKAEFDAADEASKTAAELRLEVAEAKLAAAGRTTH
jgi:F-type H+-transporting ATPase subunit epsilon